MIVVGKPSFVPYERLAENLKILDTPGDPGSISPRGVDCDTKLAIINDLLPYFWPKKTRSHACGQIDE